MRLKSGVELRSCIYTYVSRGRHIIFQSAVRNTSAELYLRVVRHMQHDPDAIDDFVASVGVEEARHVAVFAWEAEFPRT